MSDVVMEHVCAPHDWKWVGGVLTAKKYIFVRLGVIRCEYYKSREGRKQVSECPSITIAESLSPTSILLLLLLRKAHRRGLRSNPSCSLALCSFMD